jgi:hypothetical protein
MLRRTPVASLIMSQKCQKQTHASQQIAELFGRLVGECQQRRRHGESPGGLGVDDGLEFGCPTGRSVGRMLGF